MNVWGYSFLKLSFLDDHLEIEEDGLMIKKVSYRSNGTFTCRAVVDETGEVQERNIDLIIQK